MSESLIPAMTNEGDGPALGLPQGERLLGMELAIALGLEVLGVKLPRLGIVPPPEAQRVTLGARVQVPRTDQSQAGCFACNQWSADYTKWIVNTLSTLHAISWLLEIEVRHCGDNLECRATVIQPDSASRAVDPSASFHVPLPTL